MQAKFKTYGEYIEWRAHWRRDYREVSSVIRSCKIEERKPTNNTEAQKLAQSTKRRHQCLARTLMLAREAIETRRKTLQIEALIHRLTE